MLLSGARVQRGAGWGNGGVVGRVARCYLVAACYNGLEHPSLEQTMAPKEHSETPYTGTLVCSIGMRHRRHVQRLRGIRQLGLSSYVYHGAIPGRGVMLAGRFHVNTEPLGLRFFFHV